MIAKTATGIAAWPMRWMARAGDETSSLFRLMCVMNLPLMAASFLSTLTGGWALPVGFLWVLIVMGTVLLHGDRG